MDEEDSLVRRRSRRSTAGNRMEAALADMRAAGAEEAEDDVDFELVADEQDVFGSDFESTDEEEQGESAEIAERAILDDARRQRKTVRSRVEKATAIAAARQRVTFNPTAQDDAPAREPPKQKRRVSLGVAIDAATGEVVSPSPASPSASQTPQKRQSGRALAQQARTASLKRLASEEERARVAPRRRSVVKIEAPTQAELLARALDAEEGNIAAHRDYLALEEEKRRKAHAVRPSVTGPLVRWVSKREEVQVLVDEKPISQAQAGPSTAPSAASVSAPILQRQSVARQYVVHETTQDADAPPPTWNSQMRALFGTHFDWENAKVYASAKNRPMSRYIPPCAITGEPARYRDPRTGAPFANTAAFGVLTKVLDHEYTWSAALGCYVSVSASLLPEEAKRPIREGLPRSSRARIAATEPVAQDKDKGKGKARETEPEPAPAPVPVEPPKKRGPGRPRKHPLPVPKSEPVESIVEFEAPKVKRGPGRPRKVVKPVVTDEPEVVRIGW
ncbi:hypothetical protein PENSPDRAFT_759167 [Peniophora sp. CONT]|nr:hypothetical protein PENSPDRAFT_759167 [Peniophora sp. CONT]